MNKDEYYPLPLSYADVDRMFKHYLGPRDLAVFEYLRELEKVQKEHFPNHPEMTFHVDLDKPDGEACKVRFPVKEAQEWIKKCEELGI
jgi:hypothetical protein